MTAHALLSTDVRKLRASLLWLVTSIGAAHVLGFISAPLLIAFYSPAAFGTFALLSVVATMIGNVSAARYERAIVLTPCDDDAKLMLRACWGLNAAGGAIVLLVLFVATNLAARRVNLSPTLALLSGATTAAFGANQTLAHWMTRRQCFPRLAAADLCLTLVMLSWQISSGFCGRATAESLLAGMLLGRIASLLTMWYAAGSLDLRQPRSLADLRRLFLHYRSLALYSTPNAFVAALQFRGLLFVAAHFAGVAAAGRLAIAYRLTYVPATAFGMALRRVFFPTFSRALRERGTNELALAMLAFLAVIVPPAAIAGVLLLDAYGAMLPPEWHDARNYVQCLLPLAAMLVFTCWFDQVYDVLHLQRTALALEAGASTIALILYGGFAASGGSPAAALSAYTVWIFFYNAAWLVITWQLTGWPLRQLTRLLAAAAVYSFVLWLVSTEADVSLPFALALLAGSALAAWRHFSTFTSWLISHDEFHREEMA